MKTVRHIYIHQCKNNHMARRITPYLSVGCKDDRQKIKNKFDVIVSMVKSEQEQTYEFCIPDGPHEYIIFKDAVDFVIEKLDEKKSVLVQCQAGISRSVSVCIASHACHNRVSFEVAYILCSHDIYHPSKELIKSAKKYINENQKTIK